MSLITGSHHPPHTVTPDATVMEACTKMKDNNVGAVAVVSGDDRPIGMLTERDVLQKIVVGNLDAASTKVSQVMTSPCVAIPSDRTPDDALAVMLKKTIFHLALINEEQKLIGVVSYRTLLSERIETLNAEVDHLSAYMGKIDEFGGD